MMAARRVWLGLLLLLGSIRDSQAETTLPDCGSDAACSPLYDRAKQASGEHNLPEALRFYKLAYEVRADPRLLFNIARVLHKLDRSQDATLYYRQFLDSPLEDAEQKRKAEQYLEQMRSGSTLPAGRPRWRLVTGGVALGAGLLLVGFGASALAARDNCVDTQVRPRRPATGSTRLLRSAGLSWESERRQSWGESS